MHIMLFVYLISVTEDKIDYFQAKLAMSFKAQNRDVVSTEGDVWIFFKKHNKTLYFFSSCYLLFYNYNRGVLGSRGRMGKSARRDRGRMENITSIV